jgi:uncharacterized membrane protein (DUF373 family)
MADHVQSQGSSQEPRAAEPSAGVAAGFGVVLTRAIERFHAVIMMALGVMMALAILAATLDLARVFVTNLLQAPFDFLTVAELLDIFGTFMVVLIGLELLETVVTPQAELRVRVEAVLIVALIAVVRKVILLDFKDLSGLTLLAIAGLVLALTGGYTLLRRAMIGSARQRSPRGGNHEPVAPLVPPPTTPAGAPSA